MARQEEAAREDAIVRGHWTDRGRARPALACALGRGLWLVVHGDGALAVALLGRRAGHPEAILVQALADPAAPPARREHVIPVARKGIPATTLQA